MFIRNTRLPFVLKTSAYFDPVAHELELKRVFRTSWQCIGTLADLPTDGSFITFELFDKPVIARRDQGKISAFLNVCAHRHSLLTSESRGVAARLHCQYHGWEYDADGKACKVPEAKYFVPIKRGGECLRRFRCEVRGQLVFMTMEDSAPELDDFLGPSTSSYLHGHVGEDWQQVAAWSFDYPANWKVPVENSLEDYHISEVHPKTFKAPSEEEHVSHRLDDKVATFEDTKISEMRWYRFLARKFRKSPRMSYIHTQSFPNLLLASTDLVSSVQVVLPTSPTTSRGMVRLFAHKGERRASFHALVDRTTRRLVVDFTKTVFLEDMKVFADVQRGLVASEQPGVLGYREERVHAFQEYIAALCPELARAADADIAKEDGSSPLPR